MALLCALAAPQPTAGQDALECQVLRPAGLAAGDLYGCAIGADGGWAVVGSFGDDDRGAQAGAAYLFQQVGGAWVERTRLFASQPQAGAQFGWSVALSGGCALVGSRFADVAGADRAGSADLFCLGDGRWRHEAALTAADPAAGDELGWSAALDGDLAAAGVPGDDERGPSSGSVAVFERVGGAWSTEACTVTAPDGATGDAFGYAVALAGDRLVVGAPYADAAGTNSGAVYVFRRRGPCAWELEAKLTPGRARGSLGKAVAASGDLLVAGAPDLDGLSGAVYTSRRGAGGWSPLAPLAAPVAGDDQYGISVAVGGGITVAGARLDDEAGADAGASYIFLGGAPIKFTDPAGRPGDEVGFGAAVDGPFAFIGAYRNDEDGTDAGSAFVCPVGPRLSMTKTDDPDPVAPRGRLTYTLELRNDGTAAVDGVRVTDAFPSQLSGVSWSCAAGPGSACAAGGSGDLDDSAVRLAAGGGVTYTASGTVSPAASGTFCNRARAEGPGGQVATAEECTTVTALRADLAVSLTADPSPVPAGEAVTYALVVSNLGPGAVSGARVEGRLPPELAQVTCACSPGAGAACTPEPAVSGGVMTDGALDLPVGGSATYTCTGTVTGCPAALFNQASVAPPAGVTDPDPSNNAASLTTAVLPLADLAIAKTADGDDPDSVAPGGTLTYILEVRNQGPCPAVGAPVTDPFPEALGDVAWSCDADPGSACTPLGEGDLADGVSLPAGGRVVYTATGTVADCPVSSPLVNTATVDPPSGGPPDPDLSNNQATTETSLSPPCPGGVDLAVAKSADCGTLAPGDVFTYTIEATNAGPGDAPAARVLDDFPDGPGGPLQDVGWSCAAEAGAACGEEAGVGDLDQEVALPAGGRVTFTVEATVAQGAAGEITNTAQVTAGPGVSELDDSDNTDSAICPVGGVAVVKRVLHRSPTSVTYRVELANSGPFPQGDNPGDEFTDTVPAVMTVVSASATSGMAAFTPTTVRWNGAIPVGGTVIITFTATFPVQAEGMVLCNQGFASWDLDGNGSNETVIPTDNPFTPAPGDPTCFGIHAQPTDIPALSPLGFAALALLLAAAALLSLRRTL